MYDAPENLPDAVVKEVGTLSDEVAPLIAALVKEHRLPVVVLLVRTVMEKVGEIDAVAARSTRR